MTDFGTSRLRLAGLLNDDFYQELTFERLFV